MRLARLKPSLFDARYELGAGAKDGNPLAVDRIEQHPTLICKG